MGRHVYTLVGRTLDRASQQKGRYSQRFMRRWRPTVALAKFERISHLHIIATPEDLPLVRQIEGDIVQTNTDLKVEIDVLAFEDPWDLPSTFLTLLNYVQQKTESLAEAEELFLHITTGTHIQQIALFLLAESKRFRGKLLQSEPDRLVRADSQFRIIDLDLSNYDLIAERFHQERTNTISVLKGGITTRNREFNTLIEEIEAVVSCSKSPILLMGQTGVGKSDLARRIYDIKRHAHLVSGPLVSVNCSTLQSENAMSTLFGHRKGAFTGASSDRDGLLRKADNGLLFMDEIGDTDSSIQAMLLLAIEEKQFYPLGSDQPVKSNFQLIAGTNRPLLDLVEKGEFRLDLLSRLNLWEFHLPSLRDRREDIEPNMDYELDRLGASLGRRIRLSGVARQTYLNFALSGEALWTGNFRSLISSLTRLATLAPGGVITPELVSREIARLKQSWSGEAMSKPNVKASVLEQCLSDKPEILERLDAIDRHTLEFVASVCQQSKSAAEASRKLFDKSRLSRKTQNDTDRLKKYLQQFDVTVTDLFQAVGKAFKQ